MTITVSSQVNNSATAPTQTTVAQYALAQLGLLHPEAALARRAPGLALLATQPTVSAWTTTSTLSGGRLISPVQGSGPYTVNTSAPYRYFGTSPVVKGQTYPDYEYVQGQTVSNANEMGYGWADCETDAPTFEVFSRGFNNGRLLVDNFDGQGLRVVTNAGAWAGTTAKALGAQIKPSTNNPDNNIFQVSVAGTTSGAQPNWNSSAGTPGMTVVDGTVTWYNAGPAPILGQPSANDGGDYYLPVAFSTRRFRRIVWEFGQSVFGGIKVGRTDTLRRSGVPVGPRTIVIGDSFVEGTGSLAGNSFVAQLAHLRGQLDTWESGNGGTGYLNASTKTTFRGRIQDVTNYSPDIVIVTGGINDSGSAAAMQTEATLYFQAIKAGCLGITTGRPPILIVTGPFTVNGTIGSSATAVGVRDGIRAAAVQYADCYIETFYGAYPYVGPITNYLNDGTAGTANPRLWWSGSSGNVSSPGGTGNVDFIVSSDGTHPTDHGHAHLAQRIDAGIEQWRAAGCSTGYVALT